MKLYIVSTVEYGYDEYDSFVIAAESPKKAKELAKHLPCKENEMDVKLIGISNRKTPCIVHESFNAG